MGDTEFDHPLPGGTDGFMRYSRLGQLALALCLFILTVVATGPLSRAAVEKLYFKPGVIEAIGSAQWQDAFQLNFLQHEALIAKDTVMLYGSSELAALSKFHPSQLFDGKPTGFVPYVIGRGGCQDLIQVLNFASQQEGVQNKKAVIIMSVQWFTPEGISESAFSQNFSAFQAYAMLSNSSLTPELKASIAQRLLQFSSLSKEYPILAQMLALQGRQDIKSRLKWWAYWLPARMETAALELQELSRLHWYMPMLNQEAVDRNKPGMQARELPSWEELRQQAAQMGKSQTTSNSFGIVDSLYLKFSSDFYARLANTSANGKLYPSPEYDDLQLLLQVLKQEKIQPLFVIPPVNGVWYDYIGFPKSERQACYTRVRQMIEEQGFQVEDLSPHEYDPYFLQDIMHVGWKGWVYIDEAMDRYVHQGN